MQGLGVSQMSHAFDSGSRKATIHLGGGALGTTTWSRFERNIQEDFQSVSGMTTWSDTDGIEVLMVGTPPQTFYVDMIRLSNSMTVEHNVLGPSVVAHILRNRTITPSVGSSHAVADNWLHYDQVGSVMAISDAAGDLAERRYQDAWGNVQTGYGGGSFSGLWAAGEGWGHNTKETDGGTGLVRMGARQYVRSTGAFASSTAARAGVEERYSFVAARPTHFTDVTGNSSDAAIDAAIITCAAKQPCRSGGGPTGDSCFSFACCVATLLDKGNGKTPDSSVGGTVPYPDGRPAPGLVCYSSTPGSVPANCTPNGVCAAAAGDPGPGDFVHVGIVDSNGGYHECGKGMQHFGPGVPNHPAYGPPTGWHPL